MMIVDNEFHLGQTVYLRTDQRQQARMVTGLSVRPGMIVYILSLDTLETLHYAMEISAERNEVLAITSDPD